MPPVIRLPRLDGALEPYTMRQAVAWSAPAGPIRSRIAYAAAHVVSDPHATCDPLSDARLDWDATLGYRRYLWSLGLAVAEAMDTAQRGMGLGWPAARDLIRRSLAEARATGGMIACGAGTDQLTPGERVTLDDVEQAYEEQVGYVERHGGRVILMASRGDGQRHSDALLGIFDAIAPAASAALQALDRGDAAGYRRALAPTVALSRHIFQPPTHAYKTGIVFLAYLNGHQRHFRMIGAAETARSVLHLAELFRLADCAGLLLDPERAAERMRPVLAMAGVE